MSALSERLNTPISTAELQRRWTAVRAAMQDAKVDVLLMQNNNDHMGGYVKYFTDIPACNGYPVTVVFPRDTDMSVVNMGSFGSVQTLPPEGNGVWRGVKQILSTPSFASCDYTRDYDPELAVKALAPYAGATIGVVGTYQMSYATLDYIKRHLPNARFVDASDLVDRIKVIKSEEEQALVRRTAAMQDGAMKAVVAAIKPGMRDIEVAAVAQHYCLDHGSEMGIYLCASAPLGQGQPFANRHMQNRTIQAGDQYSLLIEDNGPGGMYAELGRSLVLGKVPPAMKDEFAFVLEARKFTLDHLVPGMPSKDAFAAYNDFMRQNGRPPETRLYCHGQGYDLVERPLIRQDEPFAIAAGMNIVVHPTYVQGGWLNWICDNYLIGAKGPGDRLHTFPEEIIEIA
jgi:Xaa-Pro aminopeptidase